MKRRPFLAYLIFLFPIFGSALFSETIAPGIWYNSSRFIEFTADNRIRMVLKPYYGFVFEDTGYFPCIVQDESDASSDSEVPKDGKVPNDGKVPGSALFTLYLRYAGEKKDTSVPVALFGDSLYFRFYKKFDMIPSVSPVSPSSSLPAGTLSGFYQASGNTDELRLYRSEELQEFYCYYFEGTAYYRIRYWAADVRYKDVQAAFASADGTSRFIPKFIRIGEVLYTCITSTGTVLRNYERGTFALADGMISFKPGNIVFAGTAADVLKPVRVTLSADGNLLAFGEPNLKRSKVADLDAEIKSHNGLTRPPRKPIFAYMDLDFRWDEIERIRNKTR